MDHKILVKKWNKFFNNNMLIDLNNKLCQDKEDMFDEEILNNYAIWILVAKYNQVDTNRVVADQKQLI